MPKLAAQRARETHLQDAHAVGVPQDLVRLVVVAVADVGGGDEQLEGVVLLQVQGARLNLLLQLPHAFLAVTAPFGEAAAKNQTARVSKVTTACQHLSK